MSQRKYVHSENILLPGDVIPDTIIFLKTIQQCLLPDFLHEIQKWD